MNMQLVPLCIFVAEVLLLFHSVFILLALALLFLPSLKFSSRPSRMTKKKKKRAMPFVSLAPHLTRSLRF